MVSSRWYKARTLLRKPLSNGESAYEGIHRLPSSDYTTIDEAQLYDVLNTSQSDQPVRGGNTSDVTNQRTRCVPTEMELIYVNTRTETELSSDISK
ncbi:hypothetical protein CHS0354_021450 [Potamilus streckersoni]|uniref:Uncharacterized protein n=1 Tax=Potamilus streckersoni TaxID=2493646 RepID=A0AAE0S245_9BIVA|nr:hypothetical protein CHS0354_021450 [Potamilus streckersoni]